MGRIVLTHSTYLEGLVKWAKSIVKTKGIKTITPGVIGKTKSNTQRLQIRITRQTQGGFKLIARKGNSYQEVYIVTDLGYEDMELLLKKKS